MDVINVEQLIAEVQKRSPIYDTTLKAYQNLTEKKKLWHQICQIIYTPAVWNELSSTDKTEYEKFLQKKWATLRRAFRRELALQKNTTGSAAKKRKIYHHYESLLFLLPFTASEENEPSSSDKIDIEIKLERDDVPSENQYAEYLECTVPNLHPTNPNGDYDEEVFKILEEGTQLMVTSVPKVTDPLTNQTDDDDESFLKSLLPSIKPFTSDEKLLLRIEIMKTILNFKKSLNKKK